MTAELAPRCSARASARCRSVASGVVSVPVSVPISRASRPAARSRPAISRTTVVLPLVPVTPVTSRRRQGCPCTAALAGPSARRTESTTRFGTLAGSARSVSRPTAPAETASPAYRWPSSAAPGMHANSAPGPTSRLSCSTSRISGATVAGGSWERRAWWGWIVEAPTARASSPRSIMSEPRRRFRRGVGCGERNGCGLGSATLSGLGVEFRGYAQLAQRVRRDPAHRGGGQLSAGDAVALGLVDHHQHDEGRAVVVADDPRERGGVVTAYQLVPLVHALVADVAGLPGCAGLSRDRVALHHSFTARSGQHHRLQHPHQ